MADASPPITPPLEKGFGCLTAAISLGAVFGGAVLYGAASPRTRGAVLFAAALLALAVFSRRSPLDRAALRLALLPLALPIALVTFVEVWGPLVPSASYQLDGAFALSQLTWVVPPITLVLAVIGRAVARAVLAADRPRFVLVLRALAWTATLAGAAMVVVAMTRVGRPAPHEYVRSLPVVAQVAAVDDSARSAEAVVGTLRIRHQKDEYQRCQIFVEASDATDVVSQSYFYWAQPGCGPLIVRADAALGLLIVEGTVHGVAHKTAPPHEAMILVPSRVAGAVRLPDAAVALAALGVIAALIALSRRWRGPLPDDTSACRDAEAYLDTLHFRDELGPLPMPPGMPPRLGPVVAVMAPHVESFRDHPMPVVLRVVPGSIAEHRLAARVGPAAFALAFVVIASTPLAITMVYLLR